MSRGPGQRPVDEVEAFGWALTGCMVIGILVCAVVGGLVAWTFEGLVVAIAAAPMLCAAMRSAGPKAN